MPRDVTLQLLARCSDRPPALVHGDLTTKLSAMNRHAAGCTWRPTAGLSHPDLPRWTHGRGPMGLKMGFVFYRGSEVWLTHDAPGEISPTTGLVWTDCLLWARAVTQLTRSFSIQEQHFALRPAGPRHTLLRAIDWDGTVESELLLNTVHLTTEVHGQLASLRRLLEHSAAKHLLEPHPQLRDLLDGLQGLNLTSHRPK